MKTYAEKLQDPRWNEKRLSILKRDEYKCRICGSENCVLNVHHIIYIEDHEPWDYDDNFLISVCDMCHDSEHLYDKETVSLQIIESLVQITNLPLSQLVYAFSFLPQILLMQKEPNYRILYHICTDTAKMAYKEFKAFR